MGAKQQISAFKQVAQKKAIETGIQHTVTSGLRCLSYWRLCRHPSGQMYCRNLGFQNQHEIWGSSAKPEQSVRWAEVHSLFLFTFSVTHGLFHMDHRAHPLQRRRAVDCWSLLREKELHKQKLSKKNTLTNAGDRQEAFSEKARLGGKMQRQLIVVPKGLERLTSAMNRNGSVKFISPDWRQQVICVCSKALRVVVYCQKI